MVGTSNQSFPEMAVDLYIQKKTSDSFAYHRFFAERIFRLEFLVTQWSTKKPSSPLTEGFMFIENGITWDIINEY